MHLPVTVKEIQAGYLISQYFKNVYNCTYLRMSCLAARQQFTKWKH